MWDLLDAGIRVRRTPDLDVAVQWLYEHPERFALGCAAGTFKWTWQWLLEHDSDGSVVRRQRLAVIRRDGAVLSQSEFAAQAAQPPDDERAAGAAARVTVQRTLRELLLLIVDTHDPHSRLADRGE